MSALPLRPYQRQTVDDVWRAWAGGLRRPAVVLATGLGKTVIFAHMIAEWIARNPGRKALVLAHRIELVEQAADKIRSVAPDLRVGVVKAQRNETGAQVIVASVQTLRSLNRRRMIRGVGLVVVDECHHAAAESYLQVLGHFGCLTGAAKLSAYPAWDGADAVALGVTATMARGDGLALGDVWESVVSQWDTAFGVREGHLVRPRGLRVRVEDLDMRGVRKRGGDYAVEGLGAALEASMAPERIAEAVREHAPAERAVIFMPTVSSAYVVDEAIAGAGFTHGVVHGEMAPSDRAKILDGHRAGDIQIVSNCMVLTEGWDCPPTSVAVIGRKTLSAPLYIQMVGRVLRPFPGKLSALVLDVVGASERHGLAAPVDLFGQEDLVVENDTVDDDLTDVEPDLTDALGVRRDEIYVDGTLSVEEVDLFHSSTSAWLRTRDGWFFLPAGDRYIALIPHPVNHSHFDVVAMHRYNMGESRWVKRDVSDLGYAMAWAEGDVSAMEHLTAHKSRRWRASRPTEKQVNLALREGLTVPSDALSGEVSNMIAVAQASSRIDWIMRARLGVKA